MTTLLRFILVLFAALLCSALLNYPLHLLVGEETDPHHLLNTGAKLLAIPMIVWAAKAGGVGSWRAIGYNLATPAWLRELALGWLAGVLMMTPLVLLLLGLDIRIPRALGEEWWPTILRAAAFGLLGGLLVALLEESFIRGAMYSSMRKESSVPLAVFASSLYFGLFHFIDPQPLPQGEPYQWWSGLTILAGAFERYTEPRMILDSLVALTAAGMLLALLREYRGNILMAIGVHAGWVFVIKILRSVTDMNSQSSWAWGVGGYDQVTGWISVAWLGFLMLLYLGGVSEKRTF